MKVVGHTTHTSKATHETGVYERFLELPVPVVLLAFWVVGAALMGLCAVTLYYLFFGIAG